MLGQGDRVRVLVVEDERQLADSIAEGLRLHAMAVDVAYDGEAGLERASVNDYDVMVLDRDLPIVSGDEVCTTLVQSESPVRILMLTASTAVAQRVAGLGLGPTIISPSPSPLPSLWRGCRRWRGARARRYRRCSSEEGLWSTRIGAQSCATAVP